MLDEKQILLNLHPYQIHVFQKILRAITLFFVKLREERFNTVGFMKVEEVDSAIKLDITCLRKMAQL